jgi:hypothetical protein
MSVFWLFKPVQKVFGLMVELMLNTMIRGRSLTGSDTSIFDEIAEAEMEFLIVLESEALVTMTRASPLEAVRIAEIPIPNDTGSKAFMTSS